MQITRSELFFLQIPLRLSITHGARAERTFSDSVVLKIAADDGRAGYGEAIIREYVSGSLGGGSGLHREVARAAARILSPLQGRELSWPSTREHLASCGCPPRELPILCAVETALLDLLCQAGGKDLYSLLDSRPLREDFAFGGAFPILPLDAAKKYLDLFSGFRFPNLKVKLGADQSYNADILALFRESLGAGFDLRVDANGCWGLEDAEAQLALCERFGVRIIEQPFPVQDIGQAPIMKLARSRGFIFVSDEGFLTAADVASIAAAGCFQMLNLRLSKNGGLSRVLALARDAEANGLSYQLGCMVGETGILSSLGRAAASLLREPRYLEGGYDDVLLSENVTTRSFGFGPGGRVSVVKGLGIGFSVDERQLAKLSVAREPLPQD